MSSVQEVWGTELAVPVAQLRPIDAGDETTQAVEAWLYWADRRYSFGSKTRRKKELRDSKVAEFVSTFRSPDDYLDAGLIATM